MRGVTGRYTQKRRGLWSQAAFATALIVACGGGALAEEVAGASADAKAEAAGTQDASRITSLDEVVVTGKLDSLAGIRQAMKAAERRFYERYNELNKDWRYDIICRREAPTGSRLAIDTCQAQIVADTSADQARAFVTGTAGTVPVTPQSVLRNAGAAEMRQRTLVLLKSDPELLRDLLEHARLDQMYKEMSRKKFKGHLFSAD
jgi:hypothetical protein